MNTEVWEPMVYRSKIAPARKLMFWPHDGYWQTVVNDRDGVAQGSGHFSTAEEAAQSLEGVLR